MRMLVLIVSIFALGLTSTRTSDKPKPRKSTEKLSADEIAVYKTVMQQYVASDREVRALNVAATTFPLRPDSPANRLSDCVKGIQFENLAAASNSFHDLTPQILPGRYARLVDPKVQGRIVRMNDPQNTMGKGKSVHSVVENAFATALFSLSEIAFDKEHKHAVVSYSFWCGSVCGNGATWLFEKIGNEWKKTNRNCGGWISQLRFGSTGDACWVSLTSFSNGARPLT